MPIKLLKKSEILSKKSAEKRVEIDQGKQLATKIDRLREIAAEEEASLAAYRKSTIANIQAEIEKENVKLTALKTEIDRLESERAVGMSRVHALENKATETIRAYEKLLEELADKQAKIDELLLNIKKDEARAKRDREIADSDRWLTENTLNKARNLLKKRDFILSKLSLEEQTLEDTKIKVGAELLRRENELAARERDLDIRKEKLDNREHQLYEREKAVDDKYNTLLQIEKLKK